MFHLLNVDKPAGITSRDAVNRVQRLVRPQKVGHAGTLDPLATGVLVLGIGSGTRLIEYVQRLPKSYTATFRLGAVSETDDIEGDVRQLSDAAQPCRADIEALIPNFLGSIQQRPPDYSAVKVQGQSAYKRARRGEVIELAPRTVTVHSIVVVTYAYPELVLTIHCGSGFYVRSLGRDMAQALGTGAVMTALVRTAIGPFHLKDACKLEDLTAENLSNWLLGPATVLAGLPQVVLSTLDLVRISHGGLLQISTVPEGDECVALDPSGEVVAMLRRNKDGSWRPALNFRAATTPRSPL